MPLCAASLGLTPLVAAILRWKALRQPKTSFQVILAQHLRGIAVDLEY